MTDAPLGAEYVFDPSAEILEEALEEVEGGTSLYGFLHGIAVSMGHPEDQDLSDEAAKTLEAAIERYETRSVTPSCHSFFGDTQNYVVYSFPSGTCFLAYWTSFGQDRVQKLKDCAARTALVALINEFYTWFDDGVWTQPNVEFEDGELREGERYPVGDIAFWGRLFGFEEGRWKEESVSD